MPIVSGSSFSSGFHPWMLKTTLWGPVYEDFCIFQKVRNSFFRSAAPVVVPVVLCFVSKSYLGGLCKGVVQVTRWYIVKFGDKT